MITTFASAEDAASVVRTLAGEHLIACGTILPGARSLYIWNGELQDNQEALVLFKLPSPIYATFAARLMELHPYDTPEIVAFETADVDPAYLAWAEAACIETKGART